MVLSASPSAYFANPKSRLSTPPYLSGFHLFQLFRKRLTNELGIEAMMMDAREKVEKEIKKPLMRHDKGL